MATVCDVLNKFRKLVHGKVSLTRANSWNRFVLFLFLTSLNGTVYASTIYGWIDRIEMRGNSAAIIGWTCQPSLNQSINVSIYLGGAPSSATLFKSVTANHLIDPEVSAACKTSNVAHRYEVTLSPSEVQTHTGKAAHAVGSSGSYSGTLGNSGSFTIPELPIPPTPSAPSAQDGSGSLSVSWSSVAFATRYQVRENQNNSMWQAPIDVGSNLSRSFSGFTGNSYQYQVMACNNKGCSGWSNASNSAVALGVTGYLDSVVLNSDGSASVQGWACNVKVAAPLNVSLNVGSTGGVLLTSGTTSIHAESSVNNICRTSGIPHRFQFNLSASQVAQHQNSRLYATTNGNQLNGSGGITIPVLPAPSVPAKPTVSVTGTQFVVSWTKAGYASYYNVEQNQNGTNWGGRTNTGDINSYIFTGVTGNNYQFRVQACNSTGCSSWSDASSSEAALGLLGYLDNIVLNADNSAIIRGWTCDVKVGAALTVDVYLGSATGSLFASQKTHVNAEAEINRICKTTGILHRFNIAMTVADVALHKTKELYVYGKNASNQRVLLTNSGSVSVPVPVLSQVTGPKASIAPGTYTGTVSVSLTTATSGATIRYTTDGTDVSTSSPVYSSALTLTTSTTLKVKAFKAGMVESNQEVLSYTLKVATPTASPNAGTYSAPVLVNLQTLPADATIRYTTNGEDVTSSSPIYSGPFNLVTTSTLKAKAFKSGMADSTQQVFEFIVQTNNQVIYLHTDVLGSVVMETDASGNVKKRTEYKPFGESKDN